MYKEIIFGTVALIILYAALITLPVSPTHQDVFFTVTVQNNLLNNPVITDVSVYTKPASLLPSSYAMASIFQSGDLTLQTTVSSKTVTKNVGELSIVSTPLGPSHRTISYRIPHVENPTSYTINLKENNIIINERKGAIT